MQQPQQQQQHQTVGHISVLDNKRGDYKPLRVSITDGDSGQTRWFSAVEAVGRSLEAGGQGSGPWTISYIERPYTTASGASGVNLNIRQAILGGQPVQVQPQPQPVAQPQPQPQQQPQPQVGQYLPGLPAWVLNLDDRGMSIVRQVAFKAAVESAPEAHPDVIYQRTNVFEDIILRKYQPTDTDQPPLPAEEPDPADNFYIQGEAF